MLGAIYGDKAGSIYEYSQTKEIKAVYPKELITKDSFYTDDTIETVAIADAIIHGKDYEETLIYYIKNNLKYKPKYDDCFKSTFSHNTINWAKGYVKNDSIGNGAMMRVSPVGYLFNTEEDVIINARLATIPSHNTYEAINCATIIARMIFNFRAGLSKDEVYKKLDLYPEYKPFTKFNTTCSQTIGNCLFAIYNSKSFEDAIRIIMSMGGDTDTNACIVGSVAEAMYGMSDIEETQALNGLPKQFQRVMKKAYELYK